MLKKHGKLIILATAIGLLFVGCDNNTQAVASNIGVKVNGQPIGIAEFSSSASPASGANKDAPPPVSEMAMKRIVEMELLRQAAVQSGLDKDEEIRARMAVSNRKILAMAYMDKQLAAAGEASDNEIKRYFDKNPDRFSARKQYEFKEFNIQAAADKAEAIKTQLSSNKNTAETFENWLHASGFSFNSVPTTVSSDQVNDEMLIKLKSVSVGGHLTMGNDAFMKVIFITAAHDQPLNFDHAKSQTARMVTDKKKVEILENLFKQVRDKAKIEYVLPYSEKGYISTAVHEE